jgi:hypothetical protein
MRRGPEYHKARIRRDVAIIVFTVLVAVFLSSVGFFSFILSFNTGLGFLNSLVTGIFFTSVFTTPFSIATFTELAHTTNIWHMALWGGIGAIIGDLILFVFIRDNLADDVTYILRAPRYRKFFLIFKQRIFRWITPLIGAMIIASPFPDELGIMMMGLSRLSIAALIPISFVMNFIGIILIGMVALSV